MEQRKERVQKLFTEIGLANLEVAVLQLNRRQNVGRGHDGEKEVPGGHGGCTPKSDNEAEIKRMPYELVWSRSRKSRRLKLLASKEAPHLLETKKLEVRSGADQHDSPSNEEQDKIHSGRFRCQGCAGPRIERAC